MKSLDRDSLAIVAAARGREGPTPEARERLRGKVLSRIGGAALAAAAATGVAESAAGSAIGAAGAATTGASVGAAAAGAGATVTTATGATLGGLGLLGKLGVGALLALVVGSGAYVAVHEPDPLPAVGPQAPAHAVNPGAVPGREPSSAMPAVPVPTTAGIGDGASVESTSETDTPPRGGATARSAAPSTARVDGPRVDHGASAQADELTAETAMLGEAHRALGAGNAAKAIEILDQLAARFPRGSLGPERRGARALALCALGRGAEGRREADALSRSNPGSPLAARVAGACR